MKSHKTTVVSLLLTGAFAQAGTNLFVGTWKTNIEMSNMAGHTDSYVKTATGYRFVMGPGFDYEFAIDGKDYAEPDGTTHAYTETGPRSWSTKTKTNGKVTTTSTIELSADDKTMTQLWRSPLPDGGTDSGKVIRTRVSGGPGLAGTWKTLKFETKPSVMVISAPKLGTLRIEDKTYHEVREGPTDGSSFPIFGADVQKGTVGTFKMSDANRLEWSEGLKDTTQVSGQTVVSADGKTLTETLTFNGKDSEKFTIVFDRQ